MNGPIGSAFTGQHAHHQSEIGIHFSRADSGGQHRSRRTPPDEVFAQHPTNPQLQRLTPPGKFTKLDLMVAATHNDWLGLDIARQLHRPQVHHRSFAGRCLRWRTHHRRQHKKPRRVRLGLRHQRTRTEQKPAGDHQQTQTKFCARVHGRHSGGLQGGRTIKLLRLLLASQERTRIPLEKIREARHRGRRLVQLRQRADDLLTQSTVRREKPPRRRRRIIE